MRRGKGKSVRRRKESRAELGVQGDGTYKRLAVRALKDAVKKINAGKLRKPVPEKRGTSQHRTIRAYV